MVISIDRPKLEGNIAVGENRQIGFAEFGNPQGRAVFWLHGTPGARRQIPTEARSFAARKNIRLIGIDRPGIGSSTPFQYENVLGFTDDLRTIADTLGINVPARMWEDLKQLTVAPIKIGPFHWGWWKRWCRTITIKGRLVCPDGRGVPGATICVDDIDRWFIWTSRDEVTCTTTEPDAALVVAVPWLPWTEMWTWSRWLAVAPPRLTSTSA